MKIIRGLYIVLGFVFCGIGAVGVVLPILPTTPFLLLAAFFFARGSDTFDRWFKSTKLYKNHLESFVKHRSMMLKTKVGLCAFASTMLLIGFFVMDSVIGRVVVLGVMAFKYYYFVFKIKTISPEEHREQMAKKKMKLKQEPVHRINETAQ